MSTQKSAVRHCWRRASGFADIIAPGCDSCRVALDTDVCQYAAAGTTSCPLARGRFHAVFRSATKQIDKGKYHLQPAVERFAIQEGLIARLQLERAKLVKDGKPQAEITELDSEITAAAKLASRYSRESGVSGHLAGGKEPKYDSSVFTT